MEFLGARGDMGQVSVEQAGPDQEQRDGGEQGSDTRVGESSGEAEDEILSFHTDMLFSGVIQLAQKAATQHGACQALTSFWKNSLVTYHENGKVWTSVWVNGIDNKIHCRINIERLPT